MNPKDSEIEQHSPQVLLMGFTRSRFVLWFALAAAAHVLVIGALSTGYIRDTWIDPQGAAERKAAAEAAAKALAEKANPPAPVTPPAAPAASNATTATPTVSTAPATNTPPQSELEKHKDTEVVKAITQTVSTNEIPKQPDDLGLTIKDTNIR